MRNGSRVAYLPNLPNCANSSAQRRLNGVLVGRRWYLSSALELTDYCEMLGSKRTVRRQSASRASGPTSGVRAASSAPPNAKQMPSNCFTQLQAIGAPTVNHQHNTTLQMLTKGMLVQ